MFEKKSGQAPSRVFTFEMSERDKREDAKSRAFAIESTSKSHSSMGTAAGLTGKQSLDGKDEAKLKKLLYARDVNIIVDSSWTPFRVFVASIIISHHFENFMGTMILAQFCFAIVEVDKSAQNERVPTWLQYIMVTLLAIYVIELSLRFYVLRQKFFKSKTNTLDLVVVGADCCIHLLEIIAGTMPSIAVFRIFRLTRLLRAFRVLTTFRELYIMVHSFIGAMKAIFWAALMIFVVLTLWSILAVEFLHPLNKELSDAGAHKDCERCSHAYASVMSACLTFFQQIIAGDSWGSITIPMLEKYPWTTLIYFPAYITIGMGLINLVLTVIVDRADAAKKANEEEKLHLKLMTVKHIFTSMDEDASGDVSLDEFTEGLRKSPEMKHALELLGIRVEDLSTVFLMMDYDGSGTVSCDEFVDNLFKMKSEDSFMILLYVKHFMNVMEKQIDDHVDMLREEIGQTHRFISDAKGEHLNSRVDSANDCNSICGAKGSSELWCTQEQAPMPLLGSQEIKQDSEKMYRSIEAKLAETSALGSQALKEDFEAMCRSTEAKLAETVRTLTQKLDEHFGDQRQSGKPVSPKRQSENVFTVDARSESRTKPVRPAPQLASVPERHAPLAPRSNSGTNPWEIYCGEMEIGRSPYRTFYKPNGAHGIPQPHELPQQNFGRVTDRDAADVSDSDADDYADLLFNRVSTLRLNLEV